MTLLDAVKFCCHEISRMPSIDVSTRQYPAADRAFEYIPPRLYVVGICMKQESGSDIFVRALDALFSDEWFSLFFSIALTH